MPMRRDDYAKAIKNQGFKLVNNPPGDFNCQLAALTHQAKILGILRSPETMSIMNKIVSSLKSNPYDSDGFPFLDHLADDEFASWDDYTTHMARDGTYGRPITLYAGDVAEGLTHSSRKNETELEYCKVKSTVA